MTVHNHGIDPSCKERVVGERLLGDGVVVLDMSKVPYNTAASDSDRSPAAITAGQLRWAAENCLTAHAVDNGHKAILLAIVDQIEAQTKPPRIPEPGKYGIVRASGQGLDDVEWVNEGKWWVSLDDSISPHRRWGEWRDLIDPVLIREGVEG